MIKLTFGGYKTLDGRDATMRIVVKGPVITNTVTGNVHATKISVFGKTTWEVMLPATDDPDNTPQGFTYEITVNGKVKNVSLPVNVPVVDYDTLKNVPAEIGEVFYPPTYPGPRGFKGDKGDKGDRGLMNKNDLDSIMGGDVAGLANAVAGKVNKADLPINVCDYGADPLGSVDSTAAIRAAVASGANVIYFPSGVYTFTSVTDGAALASFSNRSDISIQAANATIRIPTAYTSDALTSVFKFDNCKNVSVELGQFLGHELATPTSHLGVRGCTVVQLVNGCEGVTVKANITNARYGVQTGSYNNPALGGCRNIDVTLRTSFCGYPLAAYLADGIRHDIDANDSHRATYIAGCNNVSGEVKWSNLYIADTAYLITDALVSGSDTVAQSGGVSTASRGCTNVNISSIDKGSPVTSSTSAMCAGISVSRVDPFTHSGISVAVFTESTDAISSRVGGFRIASDAKTIWSRYAYNWEPHIVMQNIRVSGTIDHSRQTTMGNTAGDIYIVAHDNSSTHAAIIRNVVVERMTLLRSSGGVRPVTIEMPKLADMMTVTSVASPGQAWDVLTNALSTVTFRGCELGVLSPGTSQVSLVDSAVRSVTSSTNLSVSNAKTGGVGMAIKVKEITLTLDGTTTPWASAIPSGALVLSAQGRVVTGINSSAVGYQVGVTGDTARYANTNTLSVGGVFGPANQAASEIGPRYYPVTTPLVVTSKGAPFSEGSIRLVLTYATFGVLGA